MTNSISDINSVHLSLGYEDYGETIVTTDVNLANQLPKTVRPLDVLFSTMAGIRYLALYPGVVPADNRIAAADITIPSDIMNVRGMTMLKNKVYLASQTTGKLHRLNWDCTKDMVNGSPVERALPAGFNPKSLSTRNGKIYCGMEDTGNFITKMVAYDEDLVQLDETWDITPTRVPDGTAWANRRVYVLTAGDGPILSRPASTYRTSEAGHMVVNTNQNNMFRDMAYDGNNLILLNHDSNKIQRQDTIDGAAVSDVLSLDPANTDPHAMEFYTGYAWVADDADHKIYCYYYKDVSP